MRVETIAAAHREPRMIAGPLENIGCNQVTARRGSENGSQLPVVVPAKGGPTTRTVRLIVTIGEPLLVDHLVI